MKNVVRKGQKMKNVVLDTDNVIVQGLQKGRKRKKCYLIGNGHSLSIDDWYQVSKHDPGMSFFKHPMNSDDTVYAFYYTFECKGLKAAAEDLAKYVIPKLSEVYDEVILVGHSKCGLCLSEASFLAHKENVILVSIASPFQGTNAADMDTFRKILKVPVLIKVYDILFSNHPVDQDVIPGSDFIREMHKPYCRQHINIVTTLKSIHDCGNLIDFGLLLLDKLLKIDGDGIAPLASQQVKDACTLHIGSSHYPGSSLTKGLELIDNF